MSSEPIAEPDERGLVTHAGQDLARHRLVKDGCRKPEGRCVSSSAAPGSATSFAPPEMTVGACRRASRTSGCRTVRADPRWPRIVAALADLRERGRYAVRIVDADCACGTLLIAAAQHAHALGFTGIEARGIDRLPACIGRARAAARRLSDPAIGFRFEHADIVPALAEEADFPADILLWHDQRPGGEQAGVRAALAAAGVRLIGDPTLAACAQAAA